MNAISIGYNNNAHALPFDSFMEEQEGSTTTSSSEEEPALYSVVQNYDWAGTLAQVASKPEEARFVDIEQRTALHVACDHDAPVVVIEALLNAFPEASTMVGTTGMNPLHITCSSQHASTHVMGVLLQHSSIHQASMRDVDGDTPLHAACRCGAPIEVLQMLLRAYPPAVDLRDNEGLTPLHRLWVRYFVMHGEKVFHDIHANNLSSGELGEAWKKTELLLRYSYTGNNYSLLHAVAVVDCPREIVRMAAASIMEPNDMLTRDWDGNTPLILATKTPIFKVRDLSDDGYYSYDDNHDDAATTTTTTTTTANNDDVMDEADEQGTNDGGAAEGAPSVIDILVSSNPRSAAIPDKTLRLPIHWALETGKKWHQGVQSLTDAYPDALMLFDSKTKLQPFMMAAMVSTTIPSKKPDLGTIYQVLRANPSGFERIYCSTMMDCS